MKSFLGALVEQLGGCLIPLSAVIYAGNIFSLGSDLTDTSGRSVSAGKEAPSYFSHGPLLPFKTVMDFYFHGKPTKLSEVVITTQNQVKLGCPETTGFLCSSGNNIIKYGTVIKFRVSLGPDKPGTNLLLCR